MGANCAVKMAEIIDGTSNTIMLGEIRAGAVPFDSRGVWAMSGGSSALWGHGSITGGDDHGPNYLDYQSDDIIAGDAVRAAYGGIDGAAALGLPCYNYGVDVQITARSLHPGGVNTCFCDGSVHWISDYIQVTSNGSSNLSVWDRLNASADGLMLSANAY
jgi:prepilin-type processing-associated H-X9-DG protein